MNDALKHPYSGIPLPDEVWADPGRHGWYFREKMPDSVACYTRAAAPVVAVKGLVWRDDTDKAGWLERHISGVKGERRYYVVSKHKSIGARQWELENSFVGGPATKHDTLEAAKAAAQADYEARILAALDTAPADPLADERVKRLVDALKKSQNTHCAIAEHCLENKPTTETAPIFADSQRARLAIDKVLAAIEAQP